MNFTKVISRKGYYKTVNVETFIVLISYYGGAGVQIGLWKRLLAYKTLVPRQ